MNAEQAKLNVVGAAPNGQGTNGLTDAVEELRSEVVDGMLYSHTRTNTITGKLLEVTAFSYALIELLVEKGILATEELDKRKEEVVQRLKKKFRSAGMGVMLQEHEQDKYRLKSEARIDCENRLHFCKAACCKLAFALSRQDIEERVVKWDIGYPYMNAKTRDGYCVHLKRGSCRCSVYEHRPVPCRAYDCRKDKRIWVDFDKGIINPDLESLLDGTQINEINNNEVPQMSEG